MIKAKSRAFYYPLLCVIIVILFFSCKSNKLSKEKLIKYISKNKQLDQVTEIDGVKVELRFEPYELLSQQEIENISSGDTTTIEKIDTKYRSHYYFRLSLSRDNKEVIRQLGSFQKYSDMVQVLSFQMAKFVSAGSDQTDTISLSDYAFEQSYGISPSNNILIIFNKDPFTDSKFININIGEFGLGIGTLKFVFLRKDIDDIPELLNYKGIKN